MRMPPNRFYDRGTRMTLASSVLQWRAACACRRIEAILRRHGALGSHRASMEGGMRMPPNGSLRLRGLTWENSCKYERSQKDGRTESRLSRDFRPQSQARACFEGSLGP